MVVGEKKIIKKSKQNKNTRKTNVNAKSSYLLATITSASTNKQKTLGEKTALSNYFLWLLQNKREFKNLKTILVLLFYLLRWKNGKMLKKIKHWDKTYSLLWRFIFYN